MAYGVTWGSACGSALAICGVVYLPVRTLRHVEALVKKNDKMQGDVDTMKVQIAQILQIVNQKGG